MLVYVFLEFLRDAVRIRIAVRLEMYVFPVYGEAYLYYGDTISGIVVSIVESKNRPQELVQFRRER